MKTNFLNLAAKMPQNTGGGNSQTKRATLALPLRYLCAMLLTLVLGVGNVWGTDYSVVADWRVTGTGALTPTIGSTSDVVTFSPISKGNAYSSVDKTSGSNSLTGIYINNNYSSNGGDFIDIRVPAGYTIKKIDSMYVSHSSTMSNKKGVYMCYAGSQLIALDAKSTTPGTETQYDIPNVGTAYQTSSNGGFIPAFVSGASITSSDSIRCVRLYKKSSSGQSHYIQRIKVTVSSLAPASSCSAPAAPTISSEGSKTAFTVGDEIKLTATCASGTNASTTYTWYKGASWDAAKVTTPVQAASTSGATFTKTAALADEGTYWCEAANSTCTSRNTTGFAITVAAAPATTYDVTYANGGHGDAPAAANAASVTLAEITGVDGWKNTGWKANVATEVGGASVDANTLIANGSVVTLSGATTFTAQWAQTYAVTFTFGAGSGTAPSGFESVEGAKFNLPGQGEMVAPSGKAFDGWKAGSTKYAAGAEYTMDDAAVEFVAQWKATPKVIYYWQSSYSGSPTMNSAESVTGGTIEWKTDDGSKSWGNETYNKGSNEVPAELQVASGKKAVKSGGNALYAELTLSGTEKFQEGDTIYVGGYKKWMFSTTKQRYDGTTPSDDATKPMSGDVALVATGSSNSSYDDGYAIIPAGINVSTMYLIRGEGATSSIAAIKVIRPAQKEVKSTVYDLTAVKINGTAISAADLATLKTGEDYLLDLATEYPVGPTVKFARKTTITYEDDSYKVKNDTITVTASEVSGKWQAQGTIGTITYTVKAAKVSAAKVTYYDGAMKLGEEIVAINGNPAEYAAKQSKNLATFVGWYSDADLADGHLISDIAAEVITADKNVYGKWTNKYAVSTNIEQWVLTNGAGKTATTKTSALISQLGTNNFASNLAWENGNLELDSLDDDPSKDARNNAYLGLKVKKSGKMLDFRLAASKTVKVKFGEIKSTLPQVAINGGEYAAMSITDKVYTYTAAADAYISIKTADANTIVFKQIMIGDDPEFETVVLPYRVTYDADGGIFANDGKSDIYTGTPLSIGDATPADAENYLFDGWYDGDTKINAAAYVPTKNVTLVAKYVLKPSPFSLTALTYTIGAGAAQNVGYVEGTYTYTVELPYASSYENITVAATLKEAGSSIVEGAVMTVTSLPGAATFTISDGAEGTQLYTINFKKGAKDGVEIIGVVTTGGTNKTISGLYQGDASVDLDADKKLGSGKKIYVTLASGYTFEETDVLVVDVHQKADLDGGTKALEITTGVGDISGSVWKSIALEDYTTGENIIPLTGINANQTSIGLKRSNNQNTWVNGLKVYRPMNPVLKKVTVNGVEGTPVANVISIEVPASTTQTQLEAIAYDWVSNNDAWTAAHTPAAANAWEFGVANTVTLTDKDGDESVYTITVSKAEASHDATLSALSVESYSLSPAFDPAELTYNVELAKGTVIGDLPAVSYTLNHAGATAVKTNAATLPGATTIVVTAEDGLEANKKTYTINFTVSTKDKVVIFDGATDVALRTVPAALATEGFNWVKNSDNEDKFKYIEYTSVSGYTHAINTNGSSNANRNIAVTIPSKYEAQFEIAQASNSDATRHAYVGAANNTAYADALFSVESASKTDGQKATSEALAGGKTYYIHSDNSINILEINLYLDRVSEAPAISAQPAALAVCDAASNTNALSVTASVDAGTLSYQWYKVVEEGDDVAVGTNSNEFVPTALGDYYVVVTNTEGSYKPSSAKSETATVSQKAATEITGTVNVKGELGATTQKLSVTATGSGSLTYAWYAYDIVNEETIGAKLSETNELGGLTITEETQYYQVTVTGDCGSVSEILTVSKWIAVEQADVTGSRTWDWNKTSNAAAWSGVANIQLTGTDKTTDIIMANTSSTMPNNEHFRSDMLVSNGEYPARPNQDNGVFQGYAIKFHTTVPGKVAVTYRGTSGDDVVKLQINDWADETGISSGKDNMPTKKMFVPAGDVTIKEKDGKVLRIEKIVFNAKPDYTRNVSAGNYLTICLPTAGVMTGASIYEIAYYEEASHKIFLDEVMNGVMVADRPYVFQATGSSIGVFYTEEEKEPVTAGNYKGLYGTYTELSTVTDGSSSPLWDKYIISGNQYIHVDANNCILPAYRAYIDMTHVEGYGNMHYAAPAPTPGRRRIAIGGKAPQIATGLEDAAANEKPVKVLINGEMFIIRGEKMYDATGRLVK